MDVTYDEVKLAVDSLNPKITTGKNKKLVYIYLLYLAILNTQPDSPGLANVSIGLNKLGERTGVGNGAQQAIEGLIKDKLIEKRRSGKWIPNPQSKGTSFKFHSNMYSVNVPQRLEDTLNRIRRIELHLNDYLYLNEVVDWFFENNPEWPESIKDALYRYVRNVKPNKTQDQFRMAIEDLITIATTLYSTDDSIESFIIRRIRRAAQNSYKTFVFEDDFAKANKKKENEYIPQGVVMR